jgi:phosphoglycerate dehydrogenase-like enzyme
MQKPKGLFVLPAHNYHLIYGPEQVARISEWVDIYAEPQEPEAVLANPAVLADAEVIFTGWGSLSYSAEILAAAPRLKMVFYGAGTIRGTVTEAFWERGVRITSAWAANGVPVVEYTLAQIFMCLKKVYQHAVVYQTERRMRRLPVAGGYGSTVGLISLGMIGRMMAERLKPFDVHVIAYDPYVSPESGEQLGVKMVGLEDVFREADVVSLHTPWLESTVGMIKGAHFAIMKSGASFINTSRGAVVRENEMIEALKLRPDLFAVIDVTWPEPPAVDSPLFTMPNVFLTQHIAGSMDNECRRMGETMVDELRRYLQGAPLLYEITRERAALLA